MPRGRVQGGQWAPSCKTKRMSAIVDERNGMSRSVEEILVDSGERDRWARAQGERARCTVRCTGLLQIAHGAPRCVLSCRLKEVLRAKLVECGWRDGLKEHCKEIIRSKGKEKVTVDELAAEITPHGRGMRTLNRAPHQ